MERLGGRRPQDIHEINAPSSMNAKLDTFIRRLNKMGRQSGSSSSAIMCEICGGNHETVECQVGSLFASLEQV